tara:strand:+ start:254 stop:529 length:276 start_codon:yes stop_codon:yes gene_type:complete
MGYLKYKYDSTIGFNLISTEDVVSVRDDGGEIVIEYGTGYQLSLEDDNVSLSQDDVNAIIKGVNILNGSSGSKLDIELSKLVSSSTASQLS